ncbi:hypothetical protein [Bacillus thuringiensis]
MFFLENRIPNQFFTQVDSFFASIPFLSCILWSYLLFLIFLLFHV